MAQSRQDLSEGKRLPELSQKIYQKVESSVVRIECDNGNQVGSGVIVGMTDNERAIILTSCHVVAEAYEPTHLDRSLQFHDDIAVNLASDTTRFLPCKPPHAYDQVRDLALISTLESVPLGKAIRYAFLRHSGPGNLVAAMGFPDSYRLSQTIGNIKRIEGGYIVFDAHISPGSSGGPLVDKFGRMIGLSHSTFEEEGYALCSDSLVSIVDGWLRDVSPMNKWEYQKFGRFRDRLFRDWRFLAAELLVSGAIGFAIKENLKEDDLPGPITLPPLP